MDDISGPQGVSAPDTKHTLNTAIMKKSLKRPPPIAVKPKKTVSERHSITHDDNEPPEQVVFTDSLSKVGGDTKSDGHVLRMLQKHSKQKRLERHDSMILQMKRMKDRAELDFIYREDIATWFTKLFDLKEAMTADTVISSIESGELLCKLAGQVHDNLKEWKYKMKVGQEKLDSVQPPVYKSNAAPGSFHARSNLHNFLVWARDLEVPCLFESADLIEHKNSNTITNCLMDVARGAPYLKALPALIEFEKEMDEYDDAGNDDGGDASDTVDDDMNALVQEVAAIVELEKLQTKSPATSPAPSEESDHEVVLEPPEEEEEEEEEPVQVEPAGKGQYWIKGQKMHVRCFNNHIVVRVGGGWDTLGHYLSTLGGKSKNGMNVVEADKIAKNILQEKKNPKKRTSNKSSISTGKTKQSYGPAINTIDLVRTKEEGATTVTVLDTHNAKHTAAPTNVISRSGSRLKNALNVGDVASTPARTSGTARGAISSTTKKTKTSSHLISPQGTSAGGGKKTKDKTSKASPTKKKTESKLDYRKSSSAGELMHANPNAATTASKSSTFRRQATPETTRAKRQATPELLPTKRAASTAAQRRATPEVVKPQRHNPRIETQNERSVTQPTPQHDEEQPLSSAKAVGHREATPEERMVARATSDECAPQPNVLPLHSDVVLAEASNAKDTSGSLAPVRGGSDGPCAPHRDARLDANTPLPLLARSVTPSRSMLPRPSPQGSAHAYDDTPCPTPDGRHTPHDGILFSSRSTTSCGTRANSRQSSRASTGRTESRSGSRSESRNSDGVFSAASPENTPQRSASVGEMRTGGRARIIVTSSTPPPSATPDGVGVRGVRKPSDDVIQTLPEHIESSTNSADNVHPSHTTANGESRKESDEEASNSDMAATSPCSLDAIASTVASLSPDHEREDGDTDMDENSNSSTVGTPSATVGTPARQNQLAVRAPTTEEDRVAEVIFLCENLLRATTDTRHERDLALQLGYQLGLLHTTHASDELMALARLGEWRAILDHAVRAHASPSKRNRQYTVL